MCLSEKANEIMRYTIPLLTEGKEWYISYYSYDPVKKEMRRKRTKINFIKSKSDRRKYAKDLIKNISEKLSNGWSPWINQSPKINIHTIESIINQWIQYNETLVSKGIIRERSFILYRNEIKIFKDWVLTRIKYTTELNKELLSLFKDYLLNRRKIRTVNNMISIINIFLSWTRERGYIENNISILKCKNPTTKNRDTLKDEDIIRLRQYLKKNNDSFILVYELLSLCFIRPNEIINLQIKHLNKINQTIFIPKEFSKNKKDAIVTIPNSLMEVLDYYHVWDYSPNFFVFGINGIPNLKKSSYTIIHNHWKKIVKDLNFPSEYKLYSLKDTGITNMLKTKDVLTVRNQARHSSIAMTDKYTPHNIKEANPNLLNYNDNLDPSSSI